MQSKEKDLSAEMYYTKLVEKYSDMVTRLCMMHSASVWDAEDCYQNTFFKLYEALGKGVVDSPKAWLIRVCLNECHSLMRKRLRRTTVSLDELEIAAEDKSGIETLDAVWSLSPKYRDVIYLYYYEDMSVAEIAEALLIGENTVKTRLRRARQKLKEIL